MIGTLVNVLAVVVGSTLGLLFHSKVPERFIKITFNGIGIFTLVLGFGMALASNEILLMVFSIIIGSLLGEALDIDKRLNTISNQLKKRLGNESDNFSNGLITGFLLFCMGSMTILGAIQEGVGGSPDLLMTKSLMDGFASLALASTLGVGVLFSVIPLFIYQGGLTLLAAQVKDFLSPEMITEITGVGGLLLIALGLNILDLKKIKVSNMLPSLLVIIILMLIFT